MSMLSELIGTVDFVDEFIVKLIKDYEVGNINWEAVLAFSAAHERRFKLAALLENEEE